MSLASTFRFGPVQQKSAIFEQINVVNARYKLSAFGTRRASWSIEPRYYAYFRPNGMFLRRSLGVCRCSKKRRYTLLEIMSGKFFSLLRGDNIVSKQDNVPSLHSLCSKKFKFSCVGSSENASRKWRSDSRRELLSGLFFSPTPRP